MLSDASSLLSSDNFAIWIKMMHEHLYQFGDPGLALIRRVKLVVAPPSLSDVHAGLVDSSGAPYVLRKYPADDSTNQLTALGMQYFRADLALHDATMRDNMEKLRDAETQVLANYCDASAPYMIDLRVLTSSVYLNGVDQAFFQLQIDAALKANPTGCIKDTWPMAEQFHQFYLERMASRSLASNPSSGLFLSASSKVTLPPAAGLQTSTLPVLLANCVQCNAPFKQHQNRFLKYCKACHLARKGQRDPNSAGTVSSTLTPAERLARAKSYVATHDVPPPVLPVASLPSSDSVRSRFPPSEDDGSFMFVAIADPCSQAPPNPVLLASRAPSSWYYDSGASFSTVNDLSYLINPEPIEPFFLGGIGSGVSVTHVGTFPAWPDL